MKFTIAFALSLLSSALAFAPLQSSGRVSVAQNALADRIFGLDLFDSEQNKYGARKKKNLAQGKLTDKSYVPAGLTKAEYEKIRKAEVARKQKNYEDKKKNAFKYTDFTEWYAKRGTELNQGWKKAVTLGHSMAKTKYDWSGTEEAKKFASTDAEKFSQNVFGGFSGKKTVAKKAAPKKKARTF